MEQQFNSEPKGEDINLKKYVTLFYKNWYWFVFSICICLPVALVINRYTKNVYSTTSTIIIKDQSQSSSGVNEILKEFSSGRSIGNINIETEIGVLKSFYQSRKTIDNLDFRVSYYGVGTIRDVELYKSAPFKIILDTTHKQVESRPVHITYIDSSHVQVSIEDSNLTSKKLELGSWFVNNNFAFQIVKDSAVKTSKTHESYYFVINNLNYLALVYQSQLMVELLNKDATIISISVRGNIAEKNIDFINKLAEVYIKDGMDEKNIVAKNTVGFIDGLLNKIIDSLQVAENDLQSFRQNNRIIDLSKEGSAIFDKLEEQQNQKTILEIRMKYYDYLLKYIEKKNDFKDVITPSIMGIDDQLLNKLVAELSGLYQERKVMEYSVKLNNPQLDVLDVKIKNTIESLIEVVTNIIQGAKIERDEVNIKIRELDGEIKKLPLTEREMIKIKRKFDLNDNIFTFLQQKRAEAGIMSASNVSDSKVLDKASIMSTAQNGPKSSTNYMIALVLALLLPAGVIIGIDLVNQKLRNIEDLEKEIEAPIIGVVAHDHYQLDLVVHQKPKSLLAESFRTIRTNLKYLLPDREKAVISITSAVSGEGKTYTAINLATILALSNKKVLLVGLDLRKPKIHSQFNLSNEKGMSTYLIGNNSFDEIISTTNIPNLHVAVSGPIPPNPSELIESARTSSLIDEAKSRYDYVVIDTPPVSLVADAMLLSPVSDLNIFVVRFNYSVKSIVPFVNTLYQGKKLTNLCVLVNDVDLSSSFSYGTSGYSHYGYHYGYEYGNSYGYYGEEDMKPQGLFAKIKTWVTLRKSIRS